MPTPQTPDWEQLRTAFEAVYVQYHRPEFIAPDPLMAVLAYETPEAQEVAGLVAASLSFGGVRQILRSIDDVLGRMPGLGGELLTLPPREIRRRMAGFRHRYVSGEDMADLLLGVRRVLQRHGSLGDCFRAGIQEEHHTLLPAIGYFLAEMAPAMSLPRNYLCPDPARGSACKRWFMYLRWMVRKDAVDPGPWAHISPRLLVAPIDTHMHRLSLALGLTARKQGNLQTALEVTEAMRILCPEDPVRYDFSLTRLGIHPDGDMAGFLAQYGIAAARSTRRKRTLRREGEPSGARLDKKGSAGEGAPTSVPQGLT